MPAAARAALSAPTGATGPNYLWKQQKAIELPRLVRQGASEEETDLYRQDWLAKEDSEARLSRSQSELQAL